MGLFVKTDGGTNVVQFPYTLAQLRRDLYPGSPPRQPTPQQLAEFDVYKVNILVQPAHNQATETLSIQSQPTWNGSMWTLGWDIVPLSDDQKRAAVERRFANDLEQARGGMRPELLDTLRDLYAEVKAYRAGSITETPQLDEAASERFNVDVAAVTNPQRVQIATFVINKVEAYQKAKARAAVKREKALEAIGP